MENRKPGISQEMLKLIACVTMLIDHIGVAIIERLSFPGMVPCYFVCRIIGRVAFPIYCFLLVEGMRRTKSPLKYILRLGVGVLLSELPFDLIFRGGFSWTYQSVMVTLTLGAVMLLCIQKTDKKWLQALLVVPFAVLAELAKCDYGGWGIAMIAAFALLDKFSLQFVGVLLVSALMPSAGISVFGVFFSIELVAILAMLPIRFYSGRKLSYNKAIQWAFYLFYPAHLLILRLFLIFVR